MCNISDDDAPSNVIMQINFDAFITSIFLHKIDRPLKSFFFITKLRLIAI